MNINIEINNKQIIAQEGETILDACRNQGINIPTLCHIKDQLPTGACRMCVVENLKTGKLITSCSNMIEEGLQISTHSKRVAESRKVIVELLLSNHPDDCLYCTRNKNCELQDLSFNLGIRERKIRGEKNIFPCCYTGKFKFYSYTRKKVCGKTRCTSDQDGESITK